MSVEADLGDDVSHTERWETTTIEMSNDAQ